MTTLTELALLRQRLDDLIKSDGQSAVTTYFREIFEELPELQCTTARNGPVLVFDWDDRGFGVQPELTRGRLVKQLCEKQTQRPSHAIGTLSLQACLHLSL